MIVIIAVAAYCSTCIVIVSEPQITMSGFGKVNMHGEANIMCLWNTQGVKLKAELVTFMWRDIRSREKGFLPACWDDKYAGTVACSPYSDPQFHKPTKSANGTWIMLIKGLLYTGDFRCDFTFHSLGKIYKYSSQAQRLEIIGISGNKLSVKDCSIETLLLNYLFLLPHY